jgi:hypothetical protein
MIKQATLFGDVARRISKKKALKPLLPATRAMRDYNARIRKKLYLVYGSKCIICGNEACKPVLHHNDGSGEADRKKPGGPLASLRRAIQVSSNERKRYSIMCWRCHLLYHQSEEVFNQRLDSLYAVSEYRKKHKIPMEKKT